MFPLLKSNTSNGASHLFSSEIWQSIFLSLDNASVRQMSQVDRHLFLVASDFLLRYRLPSIIIKDFLLAKDKEARSKLAYYQNTYVPLPFNALECDLLALRPPATRSLPPQIQLQLIQRLEERLKCFTSLNESVNKRIAAWDEFKQLDLKAMQWILTDSLTPQQALSIDPDFLKTMVLCTDVLTADNRVDTHALNKRFDAITPYKIESIKQRAFGYAQFQKKNSAVRDCERAHYYRGHYLFLAAYVFLLVPIAFSTTMLLCHSLECLLDSRRKWSLPSFQIACMNYAAGVTCASVLCLMQLGIDYCTLEEQELKCSIIGPLDSKADTKERLNRNQRIIDARYKQRTLNFFATPFVTDPNVREQLSLVHAQIRDYGLN